MITDFASLKTAISTWLNHTLTDTQVEEIIQLGEMQIYRTGVEDSRGTRYVLRNVDMQLTASGTLSNGTATKPSDWLEDISLLVKSGVYRESVRTNLSKVQQIRDIGGDTGRYYAISGSTITTSTLQNNSYQYNYYALPAALSATNTTSWLTDNAPHVLLWSCLTMAEPFIADDERIATWANQLLTAMRGLCKEGRRSTQTHTNSTSGIAIGATRGVGSTA